MSGRRAADGAPLLERRKKFALREEVLLIQLFSKRRGSFGATLLKKEVCTKRRGSFDAALLKKKRFFSVQLFSKRRGSFFWCSSS
ncbi:MAG: hypothetical protein ACP5KJ_00570 [Candidatus Micrarchaeia archaeon]